ncbi:hypothetical protein Tco_0313211 [Tanacetum coccineum]
MAYTSSGSSSSSDSEVDSCSKSCVKAYATLKEQYDNLNSDNKSQFNLVSYKAVRLRDNALVENKKKLEKAEKERDELKLTLEKFQNSSKSLNNLLESQVSDKFKTRLGYNAATAASPTVESFVNSSEMLENLEYNRSKGYHVVPPPYTGNFIPHKPDLTFIDEIVESENMDVTSVITPSDFEKDVSNHESVGVKNNGDAVEPKTARENSFIPPIIEDWNSNDESEIDYTVRPSIEKIGFVKPARETVKKVETPKQNKHHPRGNQRNWNNLMSQRLRSDFKMINKACFVCGSFEHLHYVCDKKVVRPVWNNSRRVNHKNFSNKITHPHPKRSFVPQAVLTRTGKINTVGANVNTAGASINIVIRPINTDASTLIVNHPRPKSNAFKKGYSQSSRPFNRYYANKNSTINTNVNTARVKNTTSSDRAVVSENKGIGANVVKASTCWVWKAKNSSASTTFKKYSYIDGNPQQKEYKEKAVIDSGCSRHMTRNKSYLDEYEDYDGGFVSFGDGKGRISRKGKIKTDSLDFDDVQELMKGHVTSNKSVCCGKHLSKSKEVGTPRYLSLVVPMKKVGDKVVHKELGDKMERAATTASSLEFWETASASTSENEEMEITATIDVRIKTITVALIRRHLKLEDADGISSLPNTEIFEQLALMGYASDSDKLIF